MSEPVLQARQVTKSFAGLRALDEVDFEVRPGELVGVIGPNGAGKSTFINVLTGVYRPTRGTVTCDGRDVTNLSMPRRARLGIIRTFQGTRSFSTLKVEDAVALAAESPRARTATTSTDRILPDFGLSSYAESKIADLPYGAQKILNLALVALTRPRVLLLDEPFAGVHADDVERLSAIVDRFRSEGVALALVEHNIEALLRLADRVIVLDSGRLVFAGSPEEARVSDVVRAAYLGAGAVAAGVAGSTE